jgi:hypothetical protein
MRGFRLLGKNLTPKCCGQHMRSTDKPPPGLRGVTGTFYRCKRCGRVNVNPAGAGPAPSLERPNDPRLSMGKYSPRTAPIQRESAPCPVCGNHLASQADHAPECRFAPSA